MLYARLNRVRVKIAPEPVSDEDLSAQLQAQDQVLCIVNSRAHARDLFARIKDAAGARHLTTLMCPLHRRAALAEIRQDLKEKKPVRLIATSLIEAGVDVDFPTVWRAMTGLDSIAQAAGRCNREGGLKDAAGEFVKGIVNVFHPAESDGHNPPPAIEQFAAATREVLRAHGGDPLGLETIKAYFALVYWAKTSGATDQLDAAWLGDKPNQTQGILRAIEETARALNFPFAQIANAFRFIEDTMQPIIVPYRADGERESVAELVNSLRYVERPGAIARKLALYSVPAPRNKCAALVASSSARYLYPEKFSNQFIFLENPELYSLQSGLYWQDLTFRSIESNIIS